MKTNHLETDVLVIGAGLSGTRAAIAARDADPAARVTIAAPAFPGQGGCGPETHGVNAAVLEGDSPELHLEDTLAGGAYLNQESLARTLCERSPGEIAFLEGEGVPFDHLRAEAAGDGDEFDVVGRYGGSSVGRSLHWRDLTGRVISNALQTRLLKSSVTVLARHWLLDLLLCDGRCEGAVFLDTEWEEVLVVRARAVVLATGGGACMYPARSMSADKAATGIACALRAGAAAIDMEMVQFHPTGFRNDAGPGNGVLLEEEFRTQGAKLLNASGERFMGRYDERGELATRDVVSQAIYLEMKATSAGGVLGEVVLDLSSFSSAQLESRFPATIRRLRAYGFDLVSQPVVPVIPSSHFLMGGVEIDPRAITQIPGLLCCGEDAGGVHGANRLGGNGVADALVFGHIAGGEAAELARAAAETPAPPLESMAPLAVAGASPATAATILMRIRELMWEYCSPVRTTDELATLRAKLDELEGWAEPAEHRPTELGEALAERPNAAIVAASSVENVHLVARAIAAAAAWRRSSAGSHFLADEELEWPSARENSCVRLAAASELEIGPLGAAAGVGPGVSGENRAAPVV